MGLAAERAVEEPAAAPAARLSRAARGLFRALALAALAAALGAALGAPSAGLEDEQQQQRLRWESVACVLDTALGVPYAWGVASALRRAPALFGTLRAAGALMLAGSALARRTGRQPRLAPIATPIPGDLP